MPIIIDYWLFVILLYILYYFFLQLYHTLFGGILSFNRYPTMIAVETSSYVDNM